MNLYDKDDGFRVFSLEEANRALSAVIAVTNDALERLETLRKAYETTRETDQTLAQARFNEQTREILEGWSHEIVNLGAYPKGYFTVDFKSTVPDTLLCWTFGEEEITHTHKIYENFKDRIPIVDRKYFGFEDSIN